MHTGEDQLLHGARLRQLLGHDVLPVLRLLYAQMAAACAHLAKLLKAKPGQQQVPKLGLPYTGSQFTHHEFWRLQTMNNSLVVAMRRTDSRFEALCKNV